MGRRIERVEVGRERTVRRTSKQALIDAHLGIPYLTLRGRRGGSAIAAAAINALADDQPGAAA